VAKRPERSGLAGEADAIVGQLRLLRRDLLRNPYADAAAHGLTGPQVTVMTLLVTKGPITVTEASRWLRMSHSTVSGIIDRLEARGLVRRTTDIKDRRRTVVAVTQDVHRYVSELRDGPPRLLSALRAATPGQRAAIKKGLTLLCKLLGDADVPAVSGRKEGRSPSIPDESGPSGARRQRP
jgi:DNA-binding MarR family transcriptional regulator